MMHLQTPEELSYSFGQDSTFPQRPDPVRNNGKYSMEKALGVFSKDCAVARSLLTSKEACSYVGISPASLSRAIRGKLGTKLRVIRLGRKHFFRPEALEQWLMENES